MSALLSTENLQAGYGASQVLFGIDVSMGEGQVLTLLGRNGMGKSTFVKAVCGMIRPTGGTIRFANADTTHAPSYRIAQAGVGLVPEGRQVFPTLTVRENLIATASTRNGKSWTLERVTKLFPRLGERLGQLAGKMSGGEQQMLAVGRALMTNPKLLILDEATEGLAPLIRAEIWNCIATLKNEGLSMIVIDKNLGELQRLADQHVVFEKGRIVWRGDNAALARDEAQIHNYLGV
jgi:branched-chain amino acid transport system ATP-binding protein